MDVKEGFYTIERLYKEHDPVAVKHDTRKDAMDWAQLLSEDLGPKGFVDVVYQGRLSAVWKQGQVMLVERSMTA